MGATSVPVNGSVAKESNAHTPWRISIKKMKEVLPFSTTWVDLEDTVLSEVRQTEKDIYWMISLYMCGIFFKKKNPELTDAGNKLVVAGGGGLRGREMDESD